MSGLNIFEGFHDCFDEECHVDPEHCESEIIIDGVIDKKSAIALAKAFKLTAEDLK